MGNKQSKSSMSGQYSLKGTPGPTEVRTKKDALATNGNGPPPLIYDPPDDENMNEIIDEDVNLTVVLPNGTKKQQTVKPSIPMMDLLVNLAASNKLNPAAYSLVVLTDDKWTKIDFKANKTIGLLAGEDKTVSVQIIPRKTEEKYKARSLEKPFEITIRFTVNLPGKQKKVLRISPKVSLGEVRSIVCKEKGYDPSQFVFRFPSNPTEAVPDETLVGDFKVNEIDFIAIGMIQAAAGKSLPELAQATSKTLAQSNRNMEEGQQPSAGEKKAKRGFLSMLGKKDKKQKLDEAGKRKTQSFNVHNRENDPQMRPKSMYVTSGDSEVIDLRRTTGNLHTVSNTRNTDFRRSTGNTLEAVTETMAMEVRTENLESAPDLRSNSLPKKKKKAAPPPPQQKQQNVQQTVQVEIEVKPKEVLEENRIEEISDVRVPLKKMHSRNSSDSSGYHELTLSGAESPEGAKLGNLQTTLDTTSIDSGEHGEHFNGDSGIRDMSPARRRVHGADSGVRSSQDGPVVPGKKKKRAPLPPPGLSATIKVEPQTEQPKVSIQTHKNEEDEALKAMEEVTMKFNIDSDDEHDMRMVENTSVNSEDVDIDLRRQRPPCNFVAPPPPTEPPPEDSEPVVLSAVVSQVDTVDIGVGDATTSPGPDSAKSSPRGENIRGQRSRRDSDASDSSVNTLEDISMAFKLTIAMGEEALSNESDQENDDIPDLSNEGIDEILQEIHDIANDEIAQDILKEGNSQVNLSEKVEEVVEDIPAPEINQDTRNDEIVEDIQHDESVEDIQHDIDQHFPNDDIVQDIPKEIDDVQDELRAAMPEFKQKISSLALEVGAGDDITTGDSGRSGASEEQESSRELEKSKDSSGITYEFTIDSVPPDFETKDTENEQNIVKTVEEEEEEIVETVEEITYYQRPVNIEVVETSSPRRIPDLESPKEHKSISLPSKEVLSEIPFDNSTPKEIVRVTDEITQEPQPSKAKEKEEFVISLDELSCIDFSAHVPGEKKEQRRSQSFDEGEKVGYRIEFVKMDSIETEDGVVVPDAVYLKSEEDEDNVDGSIEVQNESFEVKNKCSELNFPPKGEHEVEHVMEEKSISQIVLPAERMPMEDSVSNITGDSGIHEPEPQTFASSTKIVLSGSNRSSREPSPRKSSREPSPGRTLSTPRQDLTSDSQANLLQAQYQQLQEQFTMWQNQLMQNQKLLASQSSDSDLSTNQMPKSDSQSNMQLQQLQLQMQMQQQMMLQLQQSMNSLTLQQALAASQPGQQVPIAASTVQVTESAPRPVESGRKKEHHKEHHRDHKRSKSPEQVPPAPPMAPPPPEDVKPKVKADAKYTKPKQKKYERQLDPREQLMLDIRNRGRAGLKKVPVKATHWHK